MRKEIMSSKLKTFALSPKPIQSGAMTRKCRLSAGRFHSHESSAQPPNSPEWRSTTGNPLPASRRHLDDAAVLGEAPRLAFAFQDSDIVLDREIARRIAERREHDRGRSRI